MMTTYLTEHHRGLVYSKAYKEISLGRGVTVPAVVTNFPGAPLAPLLSPRSARAAERSGWRGALRLAAGCRPLVASATQESTSLKWRFPSVVFI